LKEGNGETTAWTQNYNIVFWNEKCAQFQVRDSGMNKDSVWCDPLEDYIDEYEVISNIHENDLEIY